jgi:SAM-dependent methyltransferase
MLLRHLANAILRPTKPERPARPLKALLAAPILFDVGGLVVQARDLVRTRQIRNSYTVEDDYHRKVHDYNAGVTQAKRIHTTRRAEEFYQILEMPPRDTSAEKLLIVGPRNMMEFWIAWLHGFAWRNISAIDLYSTNPKIVEMNMEEMTFPRESFDAVSMSATLAYAADTSKVLRGVFDVLNPGGRFAFGQTYAPDGTDWPGNLIDGATMKEMLDEVGFEIYFYRAYPKINSKGRPQTSHRFGVRKPDPEAFTHDRLSL